jgi:hypothetical protein
VSLHLTDPLIDYTVIEDRQGHYFGVMRLQDIAAEVWIKWSIPDGLLNMADNIEEMGRELEAAIDAGDLGEAIEIVENVEQALDDGVLDRQDIADQASEFLKGLEDG